ncbi:hypothetical protein [Candidatus Nitrosocosmicus arcticus]|uniref:Uncharacterized protein n=1 Tax=Candidatus Nitrosocosmicus arcticus TaxID=2035267 RepID=A0A557SRZ9_9ARCH|nr:hypothetical protein [Candidatus Nitrosocosmicus arcticus]TVP39365.1 hypothetical protein NARC_160079 [Candidatus Nitrosocosmicus arcticus]
MNLFEYLLITEQIVDSVILHLESSLREDRKYRHDEIFRNQPISTYFYNKLNIYYKNLNPQFAVETEATVWDDSENERVITKLSEFYNDGKDREIELVLAASFKTPEFYFKFILGINNLFTNRI